MSSNRQPMNQNNRLSKVARSLKKRLGSLLQPSLPPSINVDSRSHNHMAAVDAGTRWERNPFLMIIINFLILKSNVLFDNPASLLGHRDYTADAACPEPYTPPTVSARVAITTVVINYCPCSTCLFRTPIAQYLFSKMPKMYIWTTRRLT